jgi:peptidyl-prolyl cis-trans isomerase C
MDKTTIMNALRKRLLLLSITAVLFACSQHPSILAWIDEHEITRAEYDNFLLFENESGSNDKTDQYIEGEALTLAIEKSALYQNSLLATEINEKRKAWLLERYLEIFLSENINDQTIQDFYASDLNQFVEPKVEAAQILIRTTKSMTLDARREAYERAFDIYKRIKNGDSFSRLASEHSEDSLTAQKGGSLGLLSQNDINNQFSDVAFKTLKAGEVSKPFQSRFGFHILAITSEQSFEKKPLNAVKSQIIKILRKTLREKEIKRLLNSVVISKATL